MAYEFGVELPPATLGAGSLDTALQDVAEDVAGYTDEQVADKVVGDGVSVIWTGTQVEYDAIDPKVATTVYVVVG